MPAPLVSRAEAVGLLLATFRRHGYEGSSLSKLGAATGLGRSSLYHHFPGGKRDMALAVLAHADEWIASEVLSCLRGAGSPQVRLAQALGVLARFYENGAKACILGRLAASSAGARVKKRLAAVLADLIGGFERLGADAGLPRAVARSRAEDAVIRLQGALVVCAGLGDEAPFRRTLATLRKELLAAAP